MTPQLIFRSGTPPPPVPGYPIFGVPGWRGGCGGQHFFAYRGLCVGLDLGPEQLLSYIWTP